MPDLSPLSTPRPWLLALVCAGLLHASTLARSPAPEDKAPPIASVASAEVIEPLRVLGTFTNRYRFRHLYLLVPEGLSDAQIASLAQAVHAREKDAWLWLIDSDTEAQRMLDALPKIESGQAHDFPSAWFDKHVVARTALVMFPEKSRTWVLYRGQGSSQPMAKLPCIDGAGQCRD